MQGARGTHVPEELRLVRGIERPEMDAVPTSERI
jgi:hypothetical protein